MSGFATRQVHTGHRAHATPRVGPIHLSAGFVFDDAAAAASAFDGGGEYSYTRIANPTVTDVEHRLATLEGGSSALLLASGQAATTVALLTLVGAGDHIVSSAHVYEGTRSLFRENLARMGVSTTFVDDSDDPDAWARAIAPGTRAFFGESISNAANRMLDVPAVSAVARRAGIPLVVDNTFATPYLFRPLEHGADVVVHSASKFLAGHGSVLGGVVIDAGRFDAAVHGPRLPHLLEPSPSGGAGAAARFGADALLGYAREVVAPRLGPTASPFHAFLIAQGVETLSLRVRRQSRTARKVARWLEAHPAVSRVSYLGLPSHPSHALAARTLPRGYGSVFTFDVDGDARGIVERLRLFTHMTHLGDVRSLVLHPASTTHAHLSDADRRRAHVHDSTIRVSIGVESTGDLIADLASAFESVR